MRSNSTNELSCSVFGHNLERMSATTQNNSEFTCKTCHSKILVGEHGEFDVFPFQNQDIKTALRQLFILKNQYAQRELSV